MKKLAMATLGLVLLGAACSDDKVDRDGTRDEIIEQLEAAGLTADGDCIDAAMDEYSDDELKAIDEALGDGESNEQTDALLTEIQSCVTVPTG